RGHARQPHDTTRAGARRAFGRSLQRHRARAARRTARRTHPRKPESPIRYARAAGWNAAAARRPAQAIRGRRCRLHASGHDDLRLGDHRLVRDPSSIPARYLTSPPGQRGRYMLHRAPKFNVTSVVWRPGDRATAHNHETWGVIGVIDNEIEETRYRVTAGAGRATLEV